MAWADSHCHIHDERITAHDAVADAFANRVQRMITVGCDEATSQSAIDVALANAAHDVWATVGLHPHDAKDGLAWIRPMLDQAEAQRVLAVGECGLDYYYDNSPREIQCEAFAEQIRLAHHYDLPLVIHTRDAWEDTFAILETEGVPSATIFHCFSGGPTEAEQCLALSDQVYLSYSGIVSFKTAESLREAARVTPLERLLVETDSPYLAPVPHRGKRNFPAYVPLVGAHIAEALGLDVAEVEASTWKATAAAFRLPVTV